jgi:hypothetical protein
MGLVYPMVLSTLLMLGILGTMGYLFSLPASISKIVRTSAGEELELKVEASMRPSFWQYLGGQFTSAWRVGTTPRSTVNIRFQITVTGTNIANTATAYFYVEARDSSGSPTYRELNYASGTSITVGSATTFETGSMAIDTHLSHIYGSAPTADKTVNYYLWCKVEVTGLISGQKLTAEIPVQKFDSVLYDYGTQSSTSGSYVWVTKDAYVTSSSPSTNYGTSSYLYTSSSQWSYLAWVVNLGYPSDRVLSISVNLKINHYSGGGCTVEVYSTSDFSETGITWNNKPALGSSLGSKNIGTTTNVWESFSSISGLNDYFKSCINSSGYLNAYICLKTSSGSVTFYSREKSGYVPYFDYSLTYVDWSASWSWLNLDALSISSLKVTQELAPLILVFVSAVCIILLMRRR